MKSEFELYRKQRLLDDLIDMMLSEEDDNEVVCDVCGSPLFTLDITQAVKCAGCGVTVDVSSIDIE